MSVDLNSVAQPAAQVGLLAWGAVAAGRYLWSAAPAIASRISAARPAGGGSGSTDRKPPAANDRHTIVDIADRLDAAGNRAGVKLCYELLDVMKPPTTEAKP